MSFSTQLLVQLSNHHLLKHDFYQEWSKGTLTKENLQTYAAQYYHHVQAFPRYLSGTHAGCEDLQARQVLLENLMDEELGEENHPELWMRFAEGLGQSRGIVKNAVILPGTRTLVDTFFNSSRNSFEEGLGVLFAYEHQIPEIATFKLEALKKHYNLTDDRSLKFFEVHRSADIYHSQAVSDLMDTLPSSSQRKVEKAALLGAEALWGFLDGMRDIGYKRISS